jgi:hypothetical protein
MAPTDREVRRFVADSMVVRVAVRAPDGRPFLTPYWFVTAGSQICITTGRRALLARYLEADPRALLLFAAERNPRAEALLRMRATARVHAGLPLGIVARSARKYILSAGGLRCELAHLPLIGLRRRFYAQHAPAWIEFTPETVAFAPSMRDLSRPAVRPR